MISLIWLFDLLKGRRSLALFGALALISLFYIIAEYRLFTNFFISSIPDLEIN
jgi:hypothetical protein